MSSKKKSIVRHANIKVRAGATAKKQLSKKTRRSSRALPSSIAATREAPIAPTDAEIAGIATQLDTIAMILGGSSLTIEERRQQPKMKRGGANHIATILDLADRYGVTIPGGGTTEARADVKLANTLQPVSTRFTAMGALVDDLMLLAIGRAWETTTTLYAMLVRLVKRFPALQGELKPMASFMARTHKDAPSNLRRAEAGTLAKGRATRKAKKQKANAVPAAASTQPVAAAPAPVASAADTADGAAAQAPASAAATLQPSPAN